MKEEATGLRDAEGRFLSWPELAWVLLLEGQMVSGWPHQSDKRDGAALIQW